MPLRTVAVVITLLCFALPTRAFDYEFCEMIATISSGPICGSLQLAENVTSFYAFRGIPYAKPPTGERRFAELEECDPWEDTLMTVEEGPACPQLDIIYGSIPVQPKGMSEDCMYANVYVPLDANFGAVDDCDLLPILVNIHGGGYQTGSGNADLHGPEYLMYKSKMIVMSFNYRIDVFGFLSLDSDKIPGNNGLRDMVTFLKWVQTNARAFGGNPNNVTLLGQSVGSTSVHLLTLSKATEGLFQRAIMMSGTAIPNFFSASPVYAKYLANVFLKAAGITDTDPDVIHQKLIEMSLVEIMYANSLAQYETGLTTFVPVVESVHPDFTTIIDDEPISLIELGRGKDIPIMTGFTNNEAAFFRRALVLLNLIERVEQNNKIVMSLRLAFSLNDTEASAVAEKIVNRYFNGTITMDNLLKVISHSFFVYPALKLAQCRSAMGAAPLYLYEYSYESMRSMVKEALWEHYEGAAHVEDLTFIFRTNTLLGNTVSFPPCDDDGYMKDWLIDFVINFMNCDNPTCTDDATSSWPPVDHTDMQLQSISQPLVYNMIPLQDDYKDMVNFFDSLDPDIRSLSETLSIASLE